MLGPSWSRGSMTDGSCERAGAGFEAKVNRTKEGEMGRGEIGSASRSVGRLAWAGLDWLHRRWAGGGQSGCRTAGIQRRVALALLALVLVLVLVQVQVRVRVQAGQCQHQCAARTLCHASDAGSRGGFSLRAGELGSCLRWAVLILGGRVDSADGHKREEERSWVDFEAFV